MMQSSFGDANYAGNESGMPLDETESYHALKQVRKTRLNSGKGRRRGKISNSHEGTKISVQDHVDVKLKRKLARF